MTLSWLAFGALAACAAAFAGWVYHRREPPVPGRRLLGTARGSILVLVLLLLWDPRLPGAVGGPSEASERWVLLDVSASMRVGETDGDSTWASALGRAKELAGGGERVVSFGSTPRVVPRDSLDALKPTSGASRLGPALATVAEAGARKVTILSDLRLDDPVAAGLAIRRLGLDVRVESSGGVTRNAGVARFELPARAESGDTMVADVAVFSEGAGPDDTIRVEIREEDRLIASTRILPAGPGRLATAAIPLPPPRASGWVRYRVSVDLLNDAFSADDVKATWVEVDPAEGGLVLVSLRPDWEPRFLLPVLSQVSGLDTQGFLAVGEGRFLRLGAGGDVGRSSDEDEVRRLAAGAELLVVHGVGVGSPSWVQEVLSAAPRAIVFPADPLGASVAGVRSGRALAGEWYAAPDLPPSPLAASLVGADLTGLPPLTRVLPRTEPGGAPGPLQLQLQGSGPPEAALVLEESPGRREAVILASGFWRWAFRAGSEREAYRRLWAGVVGWLLASTPVEGGARVRPTGRVWGSREAMTWSAPGMVGQEIGLTLTTGDSVVLDTTVVVDGSGQARTSGLPVAEYLYRVTRRGDAEVVGSGRLEVEAHSLELFHPPAPLSGTAPGDAEGPRARGRRPGRPLRTHPVPYLLILVLLSAEWVGRRRWGLR